VNPSTATPPNIHDPALAPGGSSSGAAASVAFGLASAAIGSDTGGSVRVPAAWNDLVGLKTTSGVLSLKGSVPLAAKFDTVGPLTKSVEDTSLLFAAMAGEKPVDLRGVSLKGKRFAVLTTVALDDLRDAPRQGFEAALDRFRDAGAEIVELAVPEVAEAITLAPILYSSEAYGTWKEVIEANPDAMFAEILARFRSGKEFTAADYVAGWHKLDAYRDTYLQATAGFDAVLCPTCPITPPNVERLLTESDYYVTENLLTLRNTRIGNMMGLCALTLPTGVPACGVSLMAPPRDERRLLRLGAAAEQALA
jgi:aspartyl-tRNA(Asn)/glutamyl-tRNA(Gln) amidotransferase subunit A